MKIMSSILNGVTYIFIFRYDLTGIRPEFLRDAMPLKQVSRKIQDYLCNGEPIWQIRSRSGRARILVGHGLDHDLKCLELEYPSMLIRHVIITMFSFNYLNFLNYISTTFLTASSESYVSSL